MARLPAPLLAALFILFGGWLFPEGSAFANDAHLILVAGEVELRRGAKGQAVQVLVPVTGTLVTAGDTLVTGINGRAQLRFSDGSLISLQPRSEFRIDAYQFDMQQERGFFSLVRGALRTISGAVGKRDPDDYRMTTPTATIGIRGTEYLLEETTCTPGCYPGRTAGARVAVNAGFVVVFNPAGSIELPAGAATYVPSASRAPVPTTERPTMSAAPVSSKVAGPAPAAGTKPLAARTSGESLAQRSEERPVAGRDADAKDGSRRDTDARDGGARGADAEDGSSRRADAKDGTGRAADAKDGTGRHGDAREGTSRRADARDGTGRNAEARDGTRRRADRDGTGRHADARDGPGRRAASTLEGGDGSDDAKGSGRRSTAADRDGRREEAGDRTGRRREGVEMVDGREAETDTSRPERRNSRTAPDSDVAQVAERRGRMQVSEGEGVPVALLDRWNTNEQAPEDVRAGPPTAGTTAEATEDAQASREVTSSPRGQRNPARTDSAGRGAGAGGRAVGSGDRPVGDTGVTAAAYDSGAGALQPSTETAMSPSPVRASGTAAMSANPLLPSADLLPAAVAVSGYGSTAPVGDALGSNVQRDPDGVPVALVAIRGSGDTGGTPPADDPGTPPTGAPEPDPGTDPGSAPGTDAGAGPGAGPGDGVPLPVPGFSNSDLLSSLLQSHQVNDDLLPTGAAVRLDPTYRLESVGNCPLLDCLSRGTAQVVDSNYNTDVSWGRWVNGTARLSTLAALPPQDVELGVNNGIHYLVGVPTASMPVGGSAYYALTGATSPTFSSGAVAPGTFSGEGLVNFGSGLSTRVAIQGDVIFGSGEHYRLSSNGVQDGAGRLIEVGNSQLRMTGRSTFAGNMDVASQGSSDRLDCAGGNCQAAVRGGFYGANAASLGVGYSVGRVSPAPGSDTIRGVAVLNRR